MRSDYHRQTVSFQELFNPVGTELHDVILSQRVSIQVRHDSHLFFVVGRVAPKKVNDQLLLLGCDGS
jgi:predicted component of type VI protein secretion system